MGTSRMAWFPMARDVVGAEDIVDFTAEDDPLSRLAERIGASAGRTLARLTGLEGMQLR